MEVSVASETYDKREARASRISSSIKQQQHSRLTQNSINPTLIGCTTTGKSYTTPNQARANGEAKELLLKMKTKTRGKLCSTGPTMNQMLNRCLERRTSLLKPTQLTCCLLLLVLPCALLAQRLPVAEAWNLYDVAAHPESALAGSGSALSAIEAAANNLLNLSDSRQAQSSPDDTARPSPLGRILEAAADHALGSANGSSSSSSSDQSSRIGMQLLKPRKSSSAASPAASRKQVAAAAEQQILNQHSRIHLSGGSHYNHHQRLLPTKQRDQKLVSSLLDSATSDSRDSPLVSLFSGFKSSPITSRSSIVKAISDNKLARTLSSVSKTLGGNKYVAGAAAASALAALGLTVSKFLGPYFLAAPGSGFSKLGEPMLGAGSYLSPVSLASPGFFNTDRNFPTGDSMLVASSSQHQAAPGFMSGQQLSSGLRYPYPEFSYADTSGSSSSGSSSPYVDQSASGQFFYPSSGDGAMELASQQSSSYNQQIPRQQTFSIMSTGGSSEQQQQQLVNKQANEDAVNGHYTNFYSHNNNNNNNDQTYSQPATFMTSQNSYASAPSESRYSSSSANFMPSTSSASDQSQQGELGEASGNYYTYKAYTGEPLMPAASVESASFSAPAAAAAPPANTGVSNARRAGTVSLKLDDATRAKLYQHLLRQQQQPPMRISAQPPPVASSSSSSATPLNQQAMRPGQIAGVFVPLASNAPSAEVYRPVSAKSSRSDSTASQARSSGLYIADNLNLHAPLDNGRQQQQQLVGSASSPGYFILRPNADRQQQQQPQPQPQPQLSEARFQSSGEAKPTFGSGWQSLAANKQIDESYLQQQPQQTQPQQTNDYDQQVSDSAPRSRVATSGGGSPVNGREEQVVSVSHRISRTTPQTQSSVKVGARRPVERLTDYLDGLKGLRSGQALMGSTNPVAGQQQQQSSSYSDSQEQVRSTAAQGGQKSEKLNLLATAATSGSEDARTNLIQLGAGNSGDEDNNKNNVIKLIDANTNTMSAKSSSAAADSPAAQYDAGLVIMSPPPSPSQQSRRTPAATTDEQPASGGSHLATGELAVASQQQAGAIQHHHNHADHHSNNNNNSASNQAPHQQQPWAASAPLAKPAQLSAGDFPEMRTLTRSFGGSNDFPTVD